MKGENFSKKAKKQKKRGFDCIKKNIWHLLNLTYDMFVLFVCISMVNAIKKNKK